MQPANTDEKRSTALSRLPKWLVRLVCAFIVAFFVLAIGFVIGLRAFESMVAFHPDETRVIDYPVSARGAEEVWFNTADGVRLNGWYLQSRADCSAGTVIYFHGNAGNISSVGWIGEALVEDGFNVLLFDYRGYGKSEGKLGNEQELYSDADAAYDYVVRRSGGTKSLFLYGQSLGTVAAIDIASRKSCEGLVVESGLSSAGEMASAMLPWLPTWVHSLGRNRFESAVKISKVHCPIMIVHGDPDGTIPTEQGRTLFERANQPKKLVLVAGADHNVAGFVGRSYVDGVATFLHSALEGSRISAGPDSIRTQAISGDIPPSR